MRMNLDDTSPDTVRGFLWPVAFDWLEQNVKPDLTRKAWQFYCEVLLRARREQDPRVNIPARGPDAARMSPTTLRRVRTELESKLLLRITRHDKVSPYVYQLLDPREEHRGAELVLRVQRGRLADTLNKRYPVRDYTPDEIGRVATFLLSGRIFLGSDDIEFPDRFDADDSLVFACPFHTGGKNRENKLKVMLNSGKWWCEFQECHHSAKRSHRLRGGKGDLPHLVTALRYERDRLTGHHRNSGMLAGQGRELIEQFLTGQAATVDDLTFTSQNPQTRDEIAITYVRPASLPPIPLRHTVYESVHDTVPDESWDEEVIEP